MSEKFEYLFRIFAVGVKCDIALPLLYYFVYLGMYYLTIFSVTPLADYYIIGGIVYQGPDLGSVINSRVVRTQFGKHAVRFVFDHL